MESDRQLHPFEIKRAAAPDRKITRSFSLLQKSGKTMGTGGIICMAARPFPLDAMNSLIPVNLL